MKHTHGFVCHTHTRHKIITIREPGHFYPKVQFVQIRYKMYVDQCLQILFWLDLLALFHNFP